MALVIATESFACGGADGRQYMIAANTTLTTDHPAYAGREHLFRPAEELAVGNRALPVGPMSGRERTPSGAVETADATPGRPRQRTTPNKT